MGRKGGLFEAKETPLIYAIRDWCKEASKNGLCIRNRAGGKGKKNRLSTAPREEAEVKEKTLL